MNGKFRLAGLVLALVGVTAAAVAWGRDRLTRPAPRLGDWARVRRVDLPTTLLAGGDLQPAGQVDIACEVEDTTGEGPLTIISLVEHGATVRKGDVVCRIDGSRVEESVRQQEIAVGEARASHRQAELSLEVAEVALREHLDGLIRKKQQEYRGKAALKRSEVERQGDRLQWAEQMLEKGYLSHDDVATERQKKAKLAHELNTVEIESKVYLRYNVPKETMTLQGAIENARADLGLAKEKLVSREGRLKGLRESLAKCTVLAPRDGLILRANARSRWTLDPLQPGSKVRQGQELLSMPDDSKTEVDVSVHETVGSRVAIGTRCKIRVWARFDQLYPGRVVGKSMFPIENWKEWDESLRHYVVRVKFDQPPTGVLPLMSADVEFDTGVIPNALVVPVEAVSSADGQATCTVSTPDGPRRREITLGHSTRDLLEVTSGLEEGDDVLLPPFGSTTSAG